jgi:hypothetical protein
MFFRNPFSVDPAWIGAAARRRKNLGRRSISFSAGKNPICAILDRPDGKRPPAIFRSLTERNCAGLLPVHFPSPEKSNLRDLIGHHQPLPA